VTPEERAARERKQKIFVVVGGLLLVGLLAIQLPKLLGGSSSATQTTANATTADGAQSAPAPGGTPVALVGAEAETGKITSLSAFNAKDPFVQQVVTQNGLGAPTEGEGGKGTGGTGGTGGTTTKFATGKSSGAAVTIVTVNGTRQVLETWMKFAASDPLFVLVSEKQGS